jgi:hypothetical protein
MTACIRFIPFTTPLRNEKREKREMKLEKNGTNEGATKRGSSCLQDWLHG